MNNAAVRPAYRFSLSRALRGYANRTRGRAYASSVSIRLRVSVIARTEDGYEVSSLSGGNINTWKARTIARVIEGLKMAREAQYAAGPKYSLTSGYTFCIPVVRRADFRGLSQMDRYRRLRSMLIGFPLERA